jgi:protein-arginine kinase activator protein McsA
MSHKDYPNTHCPLTGKMCAKLKTLKITELNDGDSINFGCCQDCSATWAEQYSKKDLTPVVKPEELTLGTLPDAIKEIADIVFGQPVAKPNLPKITVSHDLTITPKLLQEAAMRVAKKKHANITCPGCKTTLEDMTKADRLGCPQCYDTFARYVQPLLEDYHGSTEHKGKVPKNHEVHQIEALFPPDDVLKFKIASLHDEKRDAINDERYERAGEIVKEIEELQLQLLDLSEAALKSECPLEDSSSQNDQSPQQKDEDQ